MEPLIKTVPSRLPSSVGDRMIAARLVTQAQMDLGLREQRRNGGLLGQVLVQLGFVTPEGFSEFLAKEAKAQTVNLKRMTIEPEVVKLIPEEVARRFGVLPISRQDGTLTVALADPLNVSAIDTIRAITGLDVAVLIAPERDIRNCLDLHYRTGDTVEESIDKVLEEKARQKAPAIEEAIMRLGDSDEDAPVIRLVSQIIEDAVICGASDIHFEPEERMMRIRTRLDGQLRQDTLIPKTMQTAVTMRMKILADLDVAETRIPQDGRASIQVGGRQVDLRVSSLPTNHGENIVARVLDSGAQPHTLRTLGFAPDVEKLFRGAISQPYGVILVTGPTGSGKTTTLYAVLREVSTMNVSVFTLEDPIEYKMPLVRQTQIKEQAGLTFSAGLRALLRQDPDIILVGETRDTETAQLMVRAALTGHLVFSTLHTNDAAGAIPRLIDMGVEPYLLPSSLLAVVAQRLVRILCPGCKAEVAEAGRVLADLGVEPPPGPPARLWRAVGCPECKRTGFKGRQGIFELMVVNEKFHDAIVHRAGAQEFARLARANGMRTMFEDGLLKAAQGLTTIEELLQAARLAPR
jgi:type IV pilus assembly protein PilB